MTFKKGHKFGYTSDEPLDRRSLTIRLKVGLLDRIEKIPDWRKKLRILLEEWAIVEAKAVQEAKQLQAGEMEGEIVEEKL